MTREVGAGRGGTARRVVAPYKILPLEGRWREAPEGFPACAQISVILRPQAEESFVTGCEKMLRFAQHDTVTFFGIVPIFSVGAAPCGRPGNDLHTGTRAATWGRPYIPDLHSAISTLHSPI